MRRLLVLVALGLCAGCTSKGTTERVLQEQGYTNVVAGSYDWFGCGKGDTFATKFTATSPAGKSVNGVVCSAWFKGSTIRFH